MIDKEYASYGNYKFYYEWDKGGNPDYPILIWIIDSSSDESVGKRYFKDGTSEQHIHNFMKKIASNNEYRKKWGIFESKEQELKNEIDELKRTQYNLFEYIRIYEETIKSNTDLKELFIKEISKNNYKNDFMTAPLQIKKKKTIVEFLNEGE